MKNSKYDPTQFEDCLIPPGHKVAIIIPFRDDGSNVRTDQLKVLLHYMIPMLIRQNIKFQFFAVTQESFQALLMSPTSRCHHYGNGPLFHLKQYKTQDVIFNRAKLFNIGFTEAKKLDEFDCFMFHDVDLILENDNAIYHCRTNPLHYSAYIKKWNYVPPEERYPRIYGGVTAFTPEAFQVCDASIFGIGGTISQLCVKFRL